MALLWYENQTASSWVWTLATDFIYYDYYRYIKRPSSLGYNTKSPAPL